MDKNTAFLITLLAGSFFIIAAIIQKILNKKSKFIDFTVGLALTTTIGLVAFDLIPESYGHLKTFNPFLASFMVLVFMAMGIVIIKILDSFIPNHFHNHSKEETDLNEHTGHMDHLGVITTIPLIIHSFIEGILLYSVAINDTMTGILVALSIALHNIPLGMQVTAAVKGSKKAMMIFLLTVATPFGAILMMLINVINPFVLGGLLGVTAGMLLFIALFELLRELIKNTDKIVSFVGMMVGILLVIFSLLF